MTALTPKKLVPKILQNFGAYLSLFYHHTRWRFPVLFLLISAGGFIEVVGIVALLPLLNVATGEATDNAISRVIIDILASIGIAPTLGNLLLVIVAIFSARGVFVYLYTYFTAQITVAVRRNVQVDIIRRFCDMTFGYYTRHSTGWFNNIVVVEVHRFISSLRVFSRLLVNAVNAIVFLPFALAMKFELTLAVFAIGGFVLWSLLGLIRRTAEQSRKQTRLMGQINAEFIQLIQAFIYLKATNAMAAANKHVIRTIYRLTDNELRIKRTAAFFVSIMEPIAIAVLASYIYYEVIILSGSLSEITVFALLLYRLLMRLTSFAPQLQAFNETMGGVFAVKEVSQDLDRHGEHSGTQAIAALDVPIVFNDISFRYGNSDILRNVNIVLPPNETIGIVGASGAGKTTFFHMLTGLLAPCSGEITIGGMSYADIDKQTLRSKIGYVTQDAIIFNDTVANNISLWQYEEGDTACLERIRQVTKTAKCDEFVDAMPKGYDTRLGDRGIKLSGGERQRIAIARELFKDPELLIFDEAASALDAESERYVQESIDRMHGERTMVVITHRLASVRNCDRIYVFRSGRVVEEGRFDKLYASKGTYFRHLCDQQEHSK